MNTLISRGIHFFAFLGLGLHVGCVAGEKSREDSSIYDLNDRLGRGINLGNALEAPREGEWGMVLQEEYFQVIRDAGFDSVRIPIRWTAHAAEDPPYTIDPDFLSRIEWAVHQAVSRGLAVVVNFHHYDALHQSPESEETRFLALWEQISSHFQDAPETVFFELLNEPHANLDNDTWNPLLRKGLSVIRKNNPHRPVLVGPVYWNNVRWLPGLNLPHDDRNLIVTFHYYYPYEFTHQGASWMPPEFRDRKNVRWTATHGERNLILKDLDIARNYGKTHDRPVNLGEYGAYYTADMTSRIRWTRFVTRSAQDRGFSTIYWEFGAGFGIYDIETKQWRQKLLEAVIEP